MSINHKEFHKIRSYKNYNFEKSATKCLVCDSKNITSWTDIENIHFDKCIDCDVRFANPMPTPSMVFDFYSIGVKRWASISEYEKSREIQFDYYLKTLKKVVNDSKQEMLDLGCGIGTFMSKALTLGWHVSGTDISPSDLKVAKSRNLNVFPLQEFETKEYDNKFSLVTMVDVLEHVTTPASVIKRVNKVLKKNGLFFIDTGDVGGLPDLFGIGKKSNPFLYNEGHFVVYTKKAIKNLLEENGFKIIQVLSEIDMYKDLEKITGEKEKISLKDRIIRMFKSRPNMFVLAQKISDI